MKPVGDFLSEKGVAYAVVGSVAGLSHGYGRATIDVDVLAEMGAELAGDFETRFGSDYFVDAEMIRDAVRWRRSFNLYHFETGIKIDIFVSKARPFDRSVMARCEMETMDDATTPAFFVESVEDLVLSKLAWYREGGEASDRQWSDIQAVLKLHQLAVDFEYLKKWATELRVLDLLERAFDQAGLSDCVDFQD